MQKKPIAVLGAGSWGTALALQIASNQYPVYLWEYDRKRSEYLQKKRENKKYLPGFKFPANLVVFHDLAEVLQSCEMVVIALPSFAFHDTLLKIKKLGKKKVAIAFGTKGLDPKTKKFFHELIEQEFQSSVPYAILTGPSFAKEVAAKLPTLLTIASPNEAFAKRLIKIFHGPTFRPYISDDVIGAEIGGLVKNVLAIAVGIADGLGYGANTRAAIITRGLSEMLRFGKMLGAKSETLYGLSGAGDLILTATDDQSRNRRFGIAVGKGKSVKAAVKALGQVVEGHENAKQLYYLCRKHKIDMPIAQTVYKIIIKKITPKQAVKNLLGRSLRREF